MAAEKPKGSRIDPERSGPIIEGIARIDMRGRIRVPQKIVAKLEWYKTSAFECLMVLEEPGRIILLPWVPFGESVIKKRSEILEILQTEPMDEDALSSLKFIEHRYDKLKIPSDNRPTLGPHVLLHLGLQENVPSRVYIIRVQSQLEIAAPSNQNRQAQIVPQQLAELP